MKRLVKMLMRHSYAVNAFFSERSRIRIEKHCGGGKPRGSSHCK